jgi:hypothetical protein
LCLSADYYIEIYLDKFRLCQLALVEHMDC